MPLRKLLIPAIIGLLFFQADGLVLLLRLQQQLIRHQVHRALIGTAGEEELCLTREAYRNGSCEEGELLLDGKRYDVHAVTFSGNRVTVSVTRDVLEEHLERMVTSLCDTGKTQPGCCPVKGKQPPPFVAVAPEFHRHTFFSATSARSTHEMRQATPMPLLEPHGPPPRFC